MKSRQRSTSHKQITGKRRGWLKIGLPITMVVIVAGGGGYYYTSQNRANGATTTSVRWVTAQQGSVQQTFSMSGTLNPVNEVSITGSGKLTSVAVKIGDKVKAGQIIAHIDASTYAPQLQEAQASLNSAKAKLIQAEEPVTIQSGHTMSAATQSPDPNVIAQDQAAVTKAAAQLSSIKQQIAACTVTTPIAGTVLSVAKPNQTQGTSGSSTSGSSYGSASNSSGGSNSVIAEIADLGPTDFEVQASVDQSDAPHVKAGQTANVALGTNGPTLSGKVVSISYIPQSSSGVTTYPVVIKVNAPADSSTTLLPGEAASVTVIEKEANNVVTIPTAAIVQQHGTTGVYVKTGTSVASSAATGAGSNSGSAIGGSGDGNGGNSAPSSSASNFGSSTSNIPTGLQFLPVTVGLYGGNRVQIKSGLAQGEQVAIVTQTTATTKNASSTSNPISSMSRFSGTQGFGSRGSYGGGSFSRSRGSSGRSGSGSTGGGNG